jgi:hypothetical protein
MYVYIITFLVEYFYCILVPLPWLVMFNLRAFLMNCIIKFIFGCMEDVYDVYKAEVQI